MGVGQDSLYQLACINFTLLLALKKSEYSLSSSGQLAWKKNHSSLWGRFGKYLQTRMMTFAGYVLKGKYPLLQSVGSESVKGLRFGENEKLQFLLNNS